MEKDSVLNKNELELITELNGLLTGFWLTDLANFCSFFYHHLSEINWIGFYLDDGKSLKLGPFQGRPACVEIAYNRGVCGHAFSRNQALIVDNVDEFPGHITCDTNSRSELVIPWATNGKIAGVLDVDAPIIGRFTDNDRIFLSRALAELSSKLLGGWEL